MGGYRWTIERSCAPVYTVKTGDSVRLIGSVRDALRSLPIQMAQARTAASPSVGVYELKSADAAIAGQLSVEQARQAFLSFAGITGVLAKSDTATQRGLFEKIRCPRAAA